LVDWLSVR
jgi:hypothetical protein